MFEARESILLIGWDFDTRIRLGTPMGGAATPDGGPARLGDFLLWLANRRPSLQVRLLRWDLVALKALMRGSTLLTILRWKLHPRITLKLDGAHPLTSSHHQKIVVIDDRIAFCGGIDVTAGRWDRREHLDDDPQRRDPGGRPQGPWHDATSAFDGDAARVIGDLGRARWKAATGQTLPPPEGSPAEPDRDCWPDRLEPTFRNVRLGIARTRPVMADLPPVLEIEAAYLDLIDRARRLIYIESQYFASRRIARALAGRLEEADGPEIVVINPVAAEGWLEPLAMDTARARLAEALHRLDRHGRLRIYHPLTAGGQAIYVHAKLMVVDDHYLRVGSSNVNNRSLRLDTECDIVLATDEPGNAGAAPVLAAVRDDLLAEHLGVDPADVTAAVARHGSLIAAIEALRRPDPRQGAGTGKTLVPYEIPDLGAVEEWLADNQILDPEGPEMVFEPLSRRKLFRRWHLRRRHRRR